MKETELEKLIGAASEALLKAFESGQKRLAEVIGNWLLKLDLKGGKVLSSSRNEGFVLSAQDELSRAMKAAGYDQFVTNFLKDFEKVNAFTQKTQKSRNDLDIPSEYLKNAQRLAVKVTANALVGQGMAARYADLVEQRLFTSVAQGGDLKSLLGAVKRDLESMNSPAAKRYIQIGRDALGQYNGLIQSKIAKDYKLNAIEYVGSLLVNSRPQCVRWVEQETILLKDLPAEIEWAEKNGSGLIEGTNANNFLIYRGGHNCRHEAIPVRK